MSQTRFMLAALALILFSVNSNACELIMGYRTSERLPYIHAEPDNQGLYLALYQLASERIGCSLKVYRAPKKRILRALRLGKVDFYPGFGFTQKRNHYAYFIANGLFERYTGISHSGIEEISSLNDLVTTPYVLLISPGGYDLDGIPKGVITRRPPEMDAAQAFELLSTGKGDFFSYDETTIRYELAHHPHPELKLHPKCCEPMRDMYLGFSRASRYFKTSPNPDYDPGQADSIANRRRLLMPGSKAHALADELERMRASGETERIRESFFAPSQVSH
ncbi:MULTISPECIES: amino acid ABC transporter [Shewanella]|uniref:amino acid ABC transporter n=1 Tax=Shewanella TaxID=22 RepID=UPI001EFD6230|nr:MULTISPECIES: amino acid ABC transporter [Shewanella]MCG9747199.1 amino acid ABC transporter [Shewanella sp. Isolate8]MCL2908749.1 amino acid ABC transporter [Shewanella aquimarina]